MSIVFNRTATIPVCLVFALYASLASQMSYAAGAVLLLVAGAALTILLGPSKGVPAVAAITAPTPVLATLPAVSVSNSWPNSGYRNSGQRETGGDR
jgi:hypothetical protein